MDCHSRFELKFAGGHCEPEPRQPANQPAEGLLKLYSGKLGAEAVMHACAEGQVVGCIAANVEPVRIGIEAPPTTVILREEIADRAAGATPLPAGILPAAVPDQLGKVDR